jgi:hypothetical protein
MVSTLGRSKIDQLLPAAPAAERAHLAGSLGSGGVLHGVSAQAVDVSQSAFVYALQYGLRLGSAVALAGALIAWTLMARRVGTVPVPPDQPLHAQDPPPARAAETIHA